MLKRILVVLAVLMLVPAKALAKAASPVLGVASYYGRTHQGKRMANGKPFNRFAFTAASRTLRLGTRVRVTNLETMQSVDVEITDRGPYVGNRILDLSEAAAKQLGYIRKGLAKVMVVVLPQADMPTVQMATIQ